MSVLYLQQNAMFLNCPGGEPNAGDDTFDESCVGVVVSYFGR
jgi:hypothetical protein